MNTPQYYQNGHTEGWNNSPPYNPAAPMPQPVDYNFTQLYVPPQHQGIPQPNGYEVQSMIQQGFPPHQQPKMYQHPPPALGSNGIPHQNGFVNGNESFGVVPNGLPQSPYHGFNSNLNGGDTSGSMWTGQVQPSESLEKHLFNKINSGINFDNYENIPVNASGKDVPEPINEFKDADLHQSVKDNIERSGYTKPTPVQKSSIPTILGNRDLMSCAQTGSGKTAAFLLPIINHILVNGPAGLKQSTQGNGKRTYFPAALVLSPTRELAIQIHKEASKFSYRTNIATSIVYGGRENYREQIGKLRSGCHILIATPGRLIDLIEQGYIGLSGIKYLVLDEADRMLDMGFEPQIRRIVGMNMPPKQERITAMFSATFPKEIQCLAQEFLREDYVFLTVGRVGSTSDNIEQKLVWVEEHDKRRVLMEIIEVEDQDNLILVFVETKRGANDLTFFLNRNQIRTVAIHGDLKQMDREKNLEQFRSGTFPILVATAVAARGLDIPNVKHVVNYDLPGDSDEYVHRIGRTGRCGNLGKSTSFFNDKNRGIGRELKTLIEESNQEVPDWLHKVASEGKIMGGGRPQNRRFGGVDFRRGNSGGGGGGFSRGGSFGHGGNMMPPRDFGVPFNGFNGGFPQQQQPPQFMGQRSFGNGFGMQNGGGFSRGGGSFNGNRGGAPRYNNGGGRGGFHPRGASGGFIPRNNGFVPNGQANGEYFRPPQGAPPPQGAMPPFGNWQPTN